MASSMRPMGRRLAVTNLMILIAGIAIGLWVAPEGWDWGVHDAISLPIRYQSPRLAAYRSSLVLVQYAQPVAAAWTLGVQAARLWRRPPVRRLAREPGAMACIAATLAMIMIGPMNHVALRLNLTP